MLSDIHFEGWRLESQSLHRSEHLKQHCCQHERDLRLQKHQHHLPCRHCLGYRTHELFDFFIHSTFNTDLTWLLESCTISPLHLCKIVITFFRSIRSFSIGVIVFDIQIIIIHSNVSSTFCWDIIHIHLGYISRFDQSQPLYSRQQYQQLIMLQRQWQN
jgi:hypothetical protein